MTEKEKKRMLDKAAKLKPKPTLLPSGAWRCRIMIGGESHSIIGDTPEEANAKALALKEGIIQKQKSPQKMTVETAVSRYIESKDSVLSPSTIRGYRRIQRNELKPLNDCAVGDLTQERVQRWVNTLSKEKSAKTVRNAHGLLTAVMAEYRPEMTFRTTLPQKDAKEIRIPSEEEIRKILAGCAGTKLELPVLLAMWLGLRMSEIRGLKKSDIKNGRIHICRAIVDGEDGPAVKKTKTVSGDRWIKLPKKIESLINEIPDTQEYLVPMTGGAIYLRFYRMCERIGVEHYRFHDLRHTAASVSVVVGVPTKYSQKRMGHSTDNMLRTVYEHTMEDREDIYSDMIDKYFEGMI